MAEAKSWFRDYIKRFFLLTGHTDDVFCLPGLEQLSLPEALHRHLRQQGYKRVVFYSGRQKLFCYDSVSYELLRYPDQAATQLAASEQEQAARRQSAAASRLAGGPLGARRVHGAVPPPSAPAAREQSQAGTANQLLHLGEMSDLDVVRRLNVCMKQQEVPTAVVFVSAQDFLHTFDPIALRAMAGNLSEWTVLSGSNRNICLWLFSRVGIAQMREELERSPVWSLLRGRWFPAEGKISNEVLIIGPPQDDETQALLQYYRLKNSLPADWKFLYQAIPVITRGLRSADEQSRQQLKYLQQQVLPCRDLQAETLETLSGHTGGPKAIEKLRAMRGMAPVADWVERKLAQLRLERRKHTAPGVNQGGHDGLVPARLLPAPPLEPWWQEMAKGMHVVLTGNPGTGKTTVAHLLGDIYREEGLLPSGHTVKVTRADLVAGYVGQTALKTAEKLAQAEGGVLFIDEAYTLADGEGGGSFGQEAIDTILEAMSDRAGRLAVVAAGYPAEMKRFIDSNSGLARRFGEPLVIPDYSAADLTAIFLSKVQQQNLEVDSELAAALPVLFENLLTGRDEKSWGNAGEAERLLREMREQQAARILLGNHGEIDESLLTVADVPPAKRCHLKPRLQLEEALAKLDHLTGLAVVKNDVRSLVNRIRLSQKQNRGAKIAPGHFIFAGAPGTGKTTVARLMGDIFRSLGLLDKGHCVETSRADLVAGYTGQTAIKTREVISRAMDGVLFIDEAYALQDGQEHGFGHEAVNELITALENHRDRLCIIFAGYSKEMEQFLAMNDGLESRIANRFEFPNYTEQELLTIFANMAAAQSYTLQPGIEECLLPLFRHWLEHADERFANGRDVRNLLGAMQKQQANRLAGRLEELAADDPVLFELTADDVAAAAPLPQEQALPKNFAPLPAAIVPSGTGRSPATAQQSVLEALLFIEVTGGKGAKTYGSGFLISPDGYAVTCAHVVAKGGQIRARLRLKGRPGGDDSWHDCQVLQIVPSADLALLKLAGSHFPWCQIAAPERPTIQGEPIGLYSYPLGQKLSSDATYTEGAVSSTSGQCDHYGERPLTTLQASMGSSGGPVFSRTDGAVIGVLLGSLSDTKSTEMNYYRPVRYVWQEFFR